MSSVMLTHVRCRFGLSALRASSNIFVTNGIYDPYTACGPTVNISDTITVAIYGKHSTACYCCSCPHSGISCVTCSRTGRCTLPLLCQLCLGYKGSLADNAITPLHAHYPSAVQHAVTRRLHISCLSDKLPRLVSVLACCYKVTRIGNTLCVCADHTFNTVIPFVLRARVS